MSLERTAHHYAVERPVAPLEHDHELKLREGDPVPQSPEAIQAARLARCPICSLHDHTNRDPFGFDKDGQAIPAWWFVCPRCGNDGEAAVYVHLWTKAGMAWLGTQPERQPA